MKQLVSISLWAIALLVGACFTACTFHEDVDASMCTQQEEQYIKLMVQLPTDNTTRAATPTAGEDGDGREGGVRHENELKNVMIFVIRHVDKLNAPAATPFLYKGYLDDTSPLWEDKSYGVDIKFKTGTYIPQENDKVIIVANAGSFLNVINNLGQLRNFGSLNEYKSWHNGASLADNDMFVMSSAYSGGDDGLVHMTSHEGTLDDPYISTLSIQRAAARIDFMYNNTDNLVGVAPYNELIYNVHTDPENLSSPTLATVHLENIIPVNLMQQSSYLIKRVTTTDAISSAVQYGALETGSSTTKPSTYVIEPHTLDKESMVTDGTLNGWYGATRAKTVCDNINTYLTSSTSITNYMLTNTAQAELGYFTHYMTLAYTNENTQSKEKHDPNFMTGLMVKAIYEPKTVYTDGAATVVDGINNYATGHTFWRYSPTNTLMAEKDSKYFENLAAAEAYKTAHPEDLAEIEMYTNGVCYYTIWLRHANIEEDPHLTFPMEYGIVRNNIYRVGVEKFTGPGTALPVMNGPEHLYLRIFVRKWNLRVQPVIRL